MLVHLVQPSQRHPTCWKPPASGRNMVSNALLVRYTLLLTTKPARSLLGRWLTRPISNQKNNIIYLLLLYNHRKIAITNHWKPFINQFFATDEAHGLTGTPQLTRPPGWWPQGRNGVGGTQGCISRNRWHFVQRYATASTKILLSRDQIHMLNAGADAGQIL